VLEPGRSEDESGTDDAAAEEEGAEPLLDLDESNIAAEDEDAPADRPGRR
jgi:hypothetical protein